MKKICIFLIVFSFIQIILAQSPIRKGKDYAVLFYVTEFDKPAVWKTLTETEKETKAIAKELETNYGFSNDIIANPSLSELRNKLVELNNRSYNENDQLFLFFSMHGHLDPDSDKGYLIPKDADDANFLSWLSYDELQTFLAKNKCKHIFLALDACHSGAFGDKASTRPIWEESETTSCEQKIQNSLIYKSRLYATSGNRNARTPGKSLFADKILETLRVGTNDGIVKVRTNLSNSLYEIASPSPEIDKFKGHEAGGDFVFVKNNTCIFRKEIPLESRQADIDAWQNAIQNNSIDSYKQYIEKYPKGLFYEFAVDRIKNIEKSQKNAIAVLDSNIMLNKKKESFESHINNTKFKMIFVEVDSNSTKKLSKVDTFNKISFKLSKDYYIGELEVSQELWVLIMGSNSTKPHFKNLKRPMESISWNDVQLFLKNLNQKTGKKYRLPTELEWEYAASGGNKNKGGYTYSGSNIIDEVGWYGNNSGSKTNFENLKANELGIYNMTGNVWEWCEDIIEDNANIHRIIKGGSWLNSSKDCLITSKGWLLPSHSDINIGFRLCLNADN